jgi:hypothetical protein
MDAYRRGVAAILKRIGQPPIMCCGHKEYSNTGKIDPLFDMNVFRMEVGQIINGTASRPVLIPVKDGSDRPTLRRGSTGGLVEEIQKKLGADDDGSFGPITEAKVRLFQRERGLVPDGIIGPKTWAALDGI